MSWGLLVLVADNKVADFRIDAAELQTFAGPLCGILC